MKKLYRIKKEHKIAGVCSGLGEYFLVDPVFFRIIFLILIIGFGMGFLIYAIMWIIVPLNGQAELSGQIRRLYTVEGDKKLAGVCAGLGQYFDLDPVIFRVLFLVGMFIGGVGVIAYIIMFMIVPKNKSHNPNV